MKRVFLSVLLLLGLAYLLLPGQFSAFKSKLFALFQPRLTVILVAFGSQDDDGRWQGEISPYMTQLKNKRDIGRSLPLCSMAFTGDLYGQPVMVAVTGMAKVKTSACVTDILHYAGPRINEVIFSGIAGISPDYGSDTPVMLGDVCINATAFDFGLQYYTADQANSQYPSPLYWSFDSPYPASGATGSRRLADELYSASQQVDWPKPSSTVQSTNLKYHSVSRVPQAWGPDVCLEATDDMFWHDTRSDTRARELGADWLNTAYRLSLTPRDVIIVTAMESVPVGAVVSWWNSSHHTQINFAYVRSGSNFDRPPTAPSKAPAASGQSSLSARNDAATDLAITTQSLPVLKMLDTRQSSQPPLFRR